VKYFEMVQDKAILRKLVGSRIWSVEWCHFQWAWM